MKKILKGTVMSDKMQKNIVVKVDTKKRHPMYSKNVLTSKNFKARNTLNAVVGQVVLIKEAKPFAKNVKWETVEIVSVK